MDCVALRARGNGALYLHGVMAASFEPMEERVRGVNTACRHCSLEQAVARVRPQLTWIPSKPGATWPILIAVPVEVIETWLLILRGEPNAQRRPRSVQKQRLYGKPAATKDDVLNIGIPLVRGMSAGDLAYLTATSASFSDFRNQIAAAQLTILDNADCW